MHVIEVCCNHIPAIVPISGAVPGILLGLGVWIGGIVGKGGSGAGCGVMIVDAPGVLLDVPEVLPEVLGVLLGVLGALGVVEECDTAPDE